MCANFSHKESIIVLLYLSFLGVLKHKNLFSVIYQISLCHISVAAIAIQHLQRGDVAIKFNPPFTRLPDLRYIKSSSALLCRLTAPWEFTQPCKPWLSIALYPRDWRADRDLQRGRILITTFLCSC